MKKLKKQKQMLTDLDDRFKLRQIFPNMITMLALAFGVSALNMAFWGRWEMALLFLALSALCDVMDGKVARMLGTESKFGAELDSLSDFVCFGIVPGFLMYQWTMNPIARLDALGGVVARAEAVGLPWGFPLFFAMCMAMRLARFNTMIGQKKPNYWKHFFMGVPAPMGAAIALFPILLWLATGQQLDVMRSPLVVGGLMVFSGAMMTSTIPTFAIKHMRLPEEWVIALRIILLFLIASLFMKPWIVLSVIVGGYLLSIPVGIYYFYRWRRKEPSK